MLFSLILYLSPFPFSHHPPRCPFIHHSGFWSPKSLLPNLHLVPWGPFKLGPHSLDKSKFSNLEVNTRTQVWVCLWHYITRFTGHQGISPNVPFPAVIEWSLFWIGGGRGAAELDLQVLAILAQIFVMVVVDRPERGQKPWLHARQEVLPPAALQLHQATQTALGIRPHHFQSVRHITLVEDPGRAKNEIYRQIIPQKSFIVGQRLYKESHLVSSAAAFWSISCVTSCCSSQKKLWMTDRSSSRLDSGIPSPAPRRARAAERTRRRSASSSSRMPSSHPCGAECSSANCCFRTQSWTLEAAWQDVHSSKMSCELWSFISAGKCRLYSCGTMFFLYKHEETKLAKTRRNSINFLSWGSCISNLYDFFCTTQYIYFF